MEKQGLFVLAIVGVAGLVTTANAVPVEWRVADGGNGHFYEAIAVPTGITWTDANEAAKSAGGYLATITSPEENNFVFSLIDNDIYWFHVPPSSNIGPWIGGYQPEGSSEPDGGWQWVTGDEEFNYTNWDEGVPDNQQRGDCIEQDYLHFGWKLPRTTKWNDLWDNCPGFLPHGYVIEIPEPATLLLLGLGGLALLRKRKR